MLDFEARSKQSRQICLPSAERAAALRAAAEGHGSELLPTGLGLRRPWGVFVALDYSAKLKVRSCVK